MSENKINKLKANMRLIKKLKKTRFYKVAKLTIVALSIATVLSFTTGFSSVDKAYIRNFYGDDWTVLEVMDYIDISEQLEDMDLDKYNITDELYNSHNISDELLPVQALKKIMSNFSEDYKGSDKDLVAHDKYIETVLTLKKQEKLVNGYIYTRGYAIANERISNATKEYVKEVYGMEHCDDLKLYKSSSSQPEPLSAVFKVGDKEFTVPIPSYFLKNKTGFIEDGVIGMANTNIKYDKNMSDNQSYNEDRNEAILNSLETSGKIFEEVINKNLTDPRYSIYN